MVPRSQMMSIRSTQTPKEFLPAIIEAAHSRYPVVGESLDDVMGVLLAKDLLPLILHNDERPFDIKELLRPATFVPESSASTCCSANSAPTATTWPSSSTNTAAWPAW